MQNHRLNIFYFLFILFFIACSNESNNEIASSNKKFINSLPTHKDKEMIEQTPLQQEDIDLYIKIYPETALFTDHLINTIIINRKDAINFFNNNNMYYIRFVYIRFKIRTGLSALEGVFFQPPNDFPPSLLLTNNDINLIRINKDKILSSHNLFMTNIKKIYYN